VSRVRGHLWSFPQHEEVIWNKTHRYSDQQLDDTYITLKGLLEVVKNSQSLCRKCAERQIEKRKTGECGKWPRRRNVTKDPHSDHTLRIFSQPSILFLPTSPSLTGLTGLSPAIPAPPMMSCYRPCNLFISSRSRITGTSEKTQSRGLRTQSPFPLSPTISIQLYTCPSHLSLHQSPTYQVIILPPLFPSGWTS
jgi:hypothetical protein